MQQQVFKEFKHKPNFDPFDQKNTNQLISNGRNFQKNKPSFANELLKTSKEFYETENDDFQDLQNFVDADFDAGLHKVETHKNKKPHSFLTLAVENELKEESISNHLEEHQEFLKESFESQQRIENIEDAFVSQDKYNPDENVKAVVSQEANKIITNALREGNQSQQEPRQDHVNDRKQQLANWENMAPTIIEDVNNKAIRIDIPGLLDIETLIVRMKNGQVSVQAVGTKETMARLQSSENLLSNKLREKNIQLASLQAFDSSLVKR